VALAGARRSVQSFQIVVVAKGGPLTNVTATPTALSDGKGHTLPAERVTLFREWFIDYTGHEAEFRNYGVRALSIFGSTARNQARPNSDIDVLVEFDGPATLDRYMTLKERLEELLQVRVDLVTTRGLKPRLKAIIDREAVLVA
jgi:predicted nucleotidyltransferase